MKDQRYEQFLSSQGVQFDYASSVNLEAIVVDQMAHENIRLGAAIDQDLVIRYWQSLEQGDEFPAIITFPRRAADRFGIINGLHRIETYKLDNRTACDAYVCKLDEVKDAITIDRLRRTVNTIEGKTISIDEALEHGAWLVLRGGLTAADAARQMRLKPQRLQAKIKTDSALDRLNRISGLSRQTLATWGMSALQDIGRIPHDTVAAAAAKLAHEARFTSEEISELSKQVRSANSDEDAKEIVAAWRTDNATRIHEAAGGRIRPSASPVRNEKLFVEKFLRKLKETDARPLEPHERRDHIAFLKRMVTELQKRIRRLEAGSVKIVREKTGTR